MGDFSQNLQSYFRQVLTGFKNIKNLRLSHLRKVFSLMGRREKIAVAVLAALAIFSLFLSARNLYYHYTVPAPATGGNFSEGVVGQPVYINPILAHQEPDLSLVKLVFSGLYKYDGRGNLIPDLAASLPAISTDQKQYTIALKKNVKWHNGKIFTADDVVFTFQALRDPAYKSPMTAMWQSTTVDKIDDYTVRFTTKDVSGPFAQNLTLPILSKAVWQNVGAQNFLLSDNNLKAVGTGPYAITEIKKQAGGKVEQISLTAFADYYAVQAKITQVTVKFYDTDSDAQNALHSREIDGYGYSSLNSPSRPDQTQGNLQQLRLPLPQYQAVFFNLNNKILADDNVRRALTLATDRREIISKVFGGNALLPTPPLLAGQGLDSAPLTAQLDLAQAGQVLDQSGWKVNASTGLRAKKTQGLELTITTNDAALNSNAASLLADQWRKLGVKVNLNVVSTQTLTENVIRPRNFDVLLFPEKFGSDPDPFAFWQSSQAKDPGFNLSAFSDPAADQLIAQARATTDRTARLGLYAQLDKIVEAKNAVLLLDQAVYNYAVETQVKNVTLHSLYDPSQRFYDLPNWYIAEARVWKR